jgi:Bacterial regulatory helix-turn-helix protein, lysR family
MKMQYVCYFLALCDEQNFTRAAKRCGVSQPSLTNAIKRLEEELGGRLFDRDRVKIRLTDLGILVRPEFEQINRSAAEAKCKAEKFLSKYSVTHQSKPMEAFMRVHHVIAVIAVLAIGAGAKQYFFPPMKAEEGHAQTNQILDVRTLESTIDVKALPMQDILSEADE